MDPPNKTPTDRNVRCPCGVSFRVSRCLVTRQNAEKNHSVVLSWCNLARRWILQHLAKGRGPEDTSFFIRLWPDFFEVVIREHPFPRAKLFQKNLRIGDFWLHRLTRHFHTCQSHELRAKMHFVSLKCGTAKNINAAAPCNFQVSNVFLWDAGLLLLHSLNGNVLISFWGIFHLPLLCN